MKRIAIILIISVVTAVSTVFAEEIVWGSMYGQYNIMPGVDAAFETDGINHQLGLYPQAEVILFSPVIGNTAFIDIGASVKGRAGIPLSSGSSFTAGLGLAGSLHLGFRGFDFPGSEYLDRIDLFAEGGFKLDFLNDSQMFGLIFRSGANYFITDNMAVGLNYSSWGTRSGPGLVFSLKPGKTPEVKGFTIGLPESTGFSADPFLLQFYTFFYSAHYAGGFYPESFIAGQGVVHRVSVMDERGNTSYTVKKALLKNLDGNRKLWSLIYKDNEERFYYEYITDSDYRVLTVLFSTDADILELSAGSLDYQDIEYLTIEDYNADRRDGVRIDVEAGRFDTTEYTYMDEAGTDVKWWLSDDVPGRLVSYKMEDTSGIIMTELIDMNSRNTPELYK